MPTGLKVKGLKEFSRAVKKADKETRGIVRDKLREAAEPVLADAKRLFDRYDTSSASGFRVRVWGRGYGVFVEQNKRRKTGKRPDFGRLQMQKALLPALSSNAANVERKLEEGLDEIADILDRRL